MLPAQTYSQSGFGVTIGTTSGDIFHTWEYDDFLDDSYKQKFKDYSGLLISLNMISAKKLYSLGGKLLNANYISYNGYEDKELLFYFFGSYGTYDILSYFPKLDNSAISNHLKLSSSITLSTVNHLSSWYDAGTKGVFGIGLTANFVSLGYLVPHIGYEKYFGALSSSFNLGISLYLKTGKEKKDIPKKGFEDF